MKDKGKNNLREIAEAIKQMRDEGEGVRRENRGNLREIAAVIKQMHDENHREQRDSNKKRFYSKEQAMEGVDEGICWFCKKNQAVDPAGLQVQLYFELSRFNGVPQYDMTQITVPRCTKCESIHFNNKLLRWGIIIAAAILGLILATKFNFDNGWAGFGIFALVIIVGFMVRELTAKSSENYKNQYIPIKRLIDHRWELTRPTKYVDNDA